MLQLFAVTLFLSAALLFSVQPMVAKMVLPLLGGSPAVWGTCMVFFQAVLLAGYAYAHGATNLLGVRRQTIVHAGLILPIFFVLPFGISSGSAGSLLPEDDPSWWLLMLLLTSVGLPFFAVSASAPLLQRWFSHSAHPAASDPYFLYGASNLGSLLALLAYPLVIEPKLSLAQQCATWTAGYGLLVALTLGCATVVWRGQTPCVATHAESVTPPVYERLRVSQVLSWLFLAFVPSSLMLGVTTYMTTDIAAIPLLWVIPLALYLLTFVLAFARRPVLRHSWMNRAFPMAAVALTFCMGVSSITQPIFIPVHLLTFFIGAMVCHGELARQRPRRENLTVFYLAMSGGGVLGGLFNALFAPVAFDRVVEYPLALVLACLALPAPSGSKLASPRVLDWAVPATIGAIAWGLLTLIQNRLQTPQADLGLKIVIALAAFACYTVKDRPVRFALAIGAVLMAGWTCTTNYGWVLYQHRNYFGILRVTYDASGNYHRLIHGQTVHGQQSLDPGRRNEPLTYYHRTGPVGQIFEVFRSRAARTDIAVAGLGAGTMACYAEPGDRWTFYEIDPAVEQVARNPSYFTFLRSSRAASTDVILGDARLRLSEAPDHDYGLIILDAFSSDAIPTHLLTREALQLYRSKLAPGGIVAFHVSNRYIDLLPVLGALARDSNMKCLSRRDLGDSADVVTGGKASSTWAVVANRGDDLIGLEHPTWEAPRVNPDEPVWTDGYSNVAEHLIARFGLEAR